MREWIWFPTKNVIKKSDVVGCLARGIWFTNSLEQGRGYSCAPQLPQNFIPGLFSVPQEGHLADERAAPQLPQNFIPALIPAPQWGQERAEAGVLVEGAATLAPMLEKRAPN